MSLIKIKSKKLLISYLLILIIFTISFSSLIKCDDILENNIGIYHQHSSKSSFPNLITNLSTAIGKTVILNCSLNNNRDTQSDLTNLFTNNKYSRTKQTTKTTESPNHFKLNPTWLKADVIYNQNGQFTGYKTENIIVTRKGIIPDLYKDKLKLITQNNNNDIQMLKITDLEIKDEGKYICREFNSQIDRLFYLNVLSPIKELQIKVNSNSKYFRDTSEGSTFSSNSNNQINTDLENDKLSLNYGATNTISIRENDEIEITCTVDSSKPSANISIWLWKRTNHQSIESSINQDDEYELSDSKKLDIISTNVIKNKDLTLKTIATAKYTPTRYDNHKLVVCVAENYALREKWESKRVLNVYYGPKCNKFQKTVYNTGINQSVELECHMSEANPPYLDFSWNFQNSQSTNRERVRSTGFISRINWTPRFEKDFGEISCVASNGLELGECKIQLELGGPPNPPYDCYYKENNKTIIIECKPGFEQGDPEVYFYLLKKKSNGVLVEYARKRDSCSFLISNLILEEHLNEFYIYSSNKFGNNKERSSKLVIENKDFLLKNSNRLENISAQNNKHLTIISGLACFLVFIFFFLCCVLMRCKKETNPNSKAYSLNNANRNYNNQSNRSSFNYQDSFNSKYNSHYNNSVNYDYNQKKDIFDEKENYLNTVSGSSSDMENEPVGIYDNNSIKKPSYNKYNSKANSIRSPSLLNNIQDLDMSPRSKKKYADKSKDVYGCSKSLIEETTETDSENYSDVNNKNKDLNDKYECEKYQKSNSISNTLRSNSKNYNQVHEKVNIWYGNNTNNLMSNGEESNDEYSGISVDKPNEPNIANKNRLFFEKLNEYKSFGINKITNNFNNQMDKNAYNEVYEDQDDSAESILSSNNNNNNNNYNKDKNIYEWKKSKLYNNETISLDVDDEKIVGILV